jgi:hypothetical protein
METPRRGRDRIFGTSIAVLLGLIIIVAGALGLLWSRGSIDVGIATATSQAHPELPTRVSVVEPTAELPPIPMPDTDPSLPLHPNLAVSALGFEPPAPVAGTPFQVTVTVENRGNDPSGAFQIEFAYANPASG